MIGKILSCVNAAKNFLYKDSILYYKMTLPGAAESRPAPLQPAGPRTYLGYSQIDTALSAKATGRASAFATQ